MFHRILRSAAAAALFVVTAGFIASPAVAQTDQQKLLAASETSLSNFMRDPEMKWLQQNFGRAKAVLISPEIVKAGFIFGGSGGRAHTAYQWSARSGAVSTDARRDRDHCHSVCR